MERGPFRGVMLGAALCALLPLQAAQTQPPVRSDHGGRFKQYKDLANIRDADPGSRLPASQPVKIVVTPPQGSVDALALGRASIDYLREYACAADVVVVATVRRASSDFTAEGTFIFTDYDLGVESVLKGDDVVPATTIRVAWPGGTVVHKGRPISTIDESFSPLTMNRRYLLFLHRISTGDFETIRETAGYDLTNPQARNVGVGGLREPLQDSTLVALTQTAASGCTR